MNDKKTQCASLTVEAGLIFPVFLFAVLALCCIFRYIDAEYTVEKSMLSVARMLGKYPEIISAATEKREGFAETILGGLADKSTPIGDISVGEMADRLTDGILIKKLLVRELDKYPFANSAIKDGSSGIDCLGSTLFSGDETILIKCSYRLKTPVSMFGLGSIPIEQELEYRYFTGYAEESLLGEEAETGSDEDDRIVYITEEKIVYHQSLSCPSLNLVISSCPYSEVGAKRNKGGGKYYPCERCARGQAPETVFIAKEGDRYHYRRDCSGLKRTITEIRLSVAAKTRRSCKRCAPKSGIE